VSTPVQILLADFSAAAHVRRESELLPQLHLQERVRYRKFAHLQRRQVWLAGRELLLAALLRYLPQVDACALVTEANGAIRYGDGGVHVSLSHSGDLLAAALAASPIGVDIEASRPRACSAQARRLFTRTETEYLQTLPPAKRQTGFYILWTLKEAIAKAAGLSLWDSLRNAEFDLPQSRIVLRAPFPDTCWNCLHAGIAAGWRLAVAARGSEDLRRVECWRRDLTGGWQEQRLLEPVILHAGKNLMRALPSVPV